MDFTWSTFGWAIFNFLVILAVLYKLFYRPLLNFLDNRRNEIARAIADSEQGRAEAEKLLSEYRAQLLAARQEAQQIILIEKGDQGRRGSAPSLLSQSKAEAATLLENARKEIQREGDQALQALRQEVVSLAMTAAGKILERNITGDDNARLSISSWMR